LVQEEQGRQCKKSREANQGSKDQQIYTSDEMQSMLDALKGFGGLSTNPKSRSHKVLQAKVATMVMKHARLCIA
jgi:hypothetical protein